MSRPARRRTAARRAARRACPTRPRSRSRGAPRSSKRSPSGSESSTIERPSSMRWSGGSSPRTPVPIHSPQPTPAKAGERKEIASTSPAAVASLPRARCSVRVTMPGDGQDASPTKRPGTGSRWPGGDHSSMKARIIGSAMMPRSTSFSQWSHQRVASWRKPMAGPGRPSWGKRCAHGPIRPRRGTLEPLEEARDRIGVGVRPPPDREDRARDGREVLADRAVAPIGVAPLVLEPERGKERQALDALEPISRASPPRRCCGSGGRA